MSISRPIVLQYGRWDQVRVDHGKEWILSLFVLEQLVHLRHNVSRAPRLQTSSKQVSTYVYLNRNYAYIHDYGSQQ